jgi:hypothetical protein
MISILETDDDEIKKLILVGYVARMWEIRNAFKLSTENLDKRGHLEELSVNERLILKLSLEK